MSIVQEKIAYSVKILVFSREHLPVQTFEKISEYCTMRWKRILLRYTRAVVVIMMSATAILLLLFSISNIGIQNARRITASQLRNRVPFYSQHQQFNLKQYIENSTTVNERSDSTRELLQSRKEKRVDITSNSSWVILEGNIVVHEGIERNQHDFEYILNSEDICSSFDPKTLRLLIFIASDVRHSQRRQIIRETYGITMLQQALNFRIVFLLGRSLTKGTQEMVREEYYQYNDIVQENFTESFQNLGHKSIMGLKWVATYCSNSDYVMKTDDDIFLHIPNLIRILERQRGKQLLLCHRNRVRKIVRKEKPLLIKYHVSRKDLPGVFFPEYCAGFGYVMSQDVALSLYKTSLITPYFFIEDVFVTGFCRYKAKVFITDHPCFVLRPHLTPAQASCAFREERVTSQELTSDEMKELWKFVNMRDFFCPRPI